MEQGTEQHRGELLESIIRKGPYSISTVAKKLGISRTTLYNKLKECGLDYDFIVTVSDLLRYDIKAEIPELDTNVSFSLDQQLYQKRMREKKYIALLERYRGIFSFLSKASYQYGLDYVRKQMDKLPEIK
jgi:hypothetical protein